MAEMDKASQERARREQERINMIRKQIDEIDIKLKECKVSKNALSACEVSLSGELERWESVNRTLHSDIRYTQIVTEDVFEGEMANALKTYMAVVEEDINTGILDTASLLGRLKTQLSVLTAYMDKLSSQRASLMSQL